MEEGTIISKELTITPKGDLGHLVLGELVPTVHRRLTQTIDSQTQPLTGTSATLQCSRSRFPIEENIVSGQAGPLIQDTTVALGSLFGLQVAGLLYTATNERTVASGFDWETSPCPPETAGTYESIEEAVLKDM